MVETKQERNRECFDRDLSRAIQRALDKNVERKEILSILSRWTEHAATLVRDQQMRAVD